MLARQGEVDGLSSLAQQVLEETYISSRVSVTATQLTARYHSLLLNIQVRVLSDLCSSVIGLFVAACTDCSAEELLSDRHTAQKKLLSGNVYGYGFVSLDHLDTKNM